MLEILKSYEGKTPEIVFEWKDHFSEAKGWVVINSLRGGASGGGTRMRKGLTRNEVVSLAKTMEIKFTVSGPNIGGAKSGIDFDPHDPRKEEVLSRWYQAILPILKTYYGTGGDMHVDEIEEVIPITEDLGLWHPQEGIVNGYYAPTPSQKVRKLGQLRLGVSMFVEHIKYTPSIDANLRVADLITGYGVASSIWSYYDLWGHSFQGKKVVIQGWGNVGAAAGYYLAQSGVKVVGIIDAKKGGFYNQEGWTVEEVGKMMVAKTTNKWGVDVGTTCSFDEAKESFWKLSAEIFIPAAGSRMVTKDNLETLKVNGLELIVSGANVPFDDTEIFFGDIMAWADKEFALLPDFIANCGMARVFAFLMEHPDSLTTPMIFNDVKDCIKKALSEVYAKNQKEFGIAETALNIALNKIA